MVRKPKCVLESHDGEGEFQRGALSQYLVKQIQQGESVRNLKIAYPSMAQKIDKWADLAPVRTHETRCIYIYGPAGTGKTIAVTEALKALGSVYPEWTYFAKPAGGSKWFDGYDQQPIVLIDDPSKFVIRNNFEAVDAFKNLISSNAMQVEVKGGFRQFNSRLVIICSNCTPTEFAVSAGADHQTAIIDRITGQRAWVRGGVPIRFADAARRGLSEYVIRQIALYSKEYNLNPIDVKKVVCQIPNYKECSGDSIPLPGEYFQRKRKPISEPISEPKQRLTNY